MPEKEILEIFFVNTNEISGTLFHPIPAWRPTTETDPVLLYSIMKSVVNFCQYCCADEANMLILQNISTFIVRVPLFLLIFFYR